MIVSGLMAAQAWSALRFHRALARPERAQAGCLARVLDAVSGSAQAARVPGFSRVRTAREFQDAFPLTTPDSVLADIEALKGGASRVLTREPVVRFEPSGGSSGASKFIPMTRGLSREFHEGLAPMLFDMFATRPGVRAGPSYWSISPIGRKQGRTAGGTPVGSVEDSAYFPRPLQPLLARVFAVPGAVAHLPDVESCRYVTLWFLVARGDLALLSVWNPSFLTLLMDALERHGERLAEDLARGFCRPPGAEREEVRAALARMRFSPHPERARVLREALRADVRGPVLWPRLALLSMWTEAQAERAVAPACRHFPGVEVQGKGLLATEGIVTLPLVSAPAPVLAVRSHFFEFLDPAHPEARPRLAHELEQGREYAVVLSTSGGLVRYQLGDRVRVEGFHQATPCLRFLGRADAVCDLVGEKLSSSRVSHVLATTLPALLGQRPAFAMMAPEWEPPAAPPEYRLFLDTDAPPARLEEAAHALERVLCEGFHYRYARELGQLGPLRVLRVSGGARRYEARCIALGQRAGDIKPADLHRQPGWTNWFAL
ncbi:GH3 family domain-containing protein [Archangium primigenium]|uniref:GH3 family domain-containing protein n=1 Tax=[Archangium] primigenium TaxID=2792470 RepID=UPI001959418D|nr:GH3 auxin-responsive promoter family protein [Archangium primigenium]MBM7112889.1 GH3 auxin-responsive promoter family protein [Archangium primigenium]